ncbi:caspase family protein [Mucilaginibacter pedocola]|uniref:Peptidase C14 caspase domain-containing protein n=1 Tax=Mucilaginibacter pedocola TaxID=1792845 RepID=A0A1S9PJS4_9SPHI|nr:caspase family protein [Mucilaginibacter pedocola]OOQ61206.1 hypothetical protein BC343_22475 [Mucilaginibacter pedocola]
MKKGLWLALALLGSALAGYSQTGNIVIPNGNAEQIRFVLLDKQSKYLYTVESPKAVMWDAKTHEQLYSWPLAMEYIKDAQVSHDGTILAIAGLSDVTFFSTVTGKKLFTTDSSLGGRNCKFSADDKTIYRYKRGIIAVDIATQAETELIPDDGYDDPQLELLDDGRIITHSDRGWKIWNLAQKKKEFEYKYTRQAKETYLPAMKAIAGPAEGSGIAFRDMNTGKVLKTLPVMTNNYKLFPSVNNKDFIFNDGAFESYLYTVYNGETFLPVKKFDAGGNLNEGYFTGAQHTMYATHYSEVFLLNTTTGKSGAAFKKLVSDLGRDVFSSMEYDFRTGILNIITDDSVYRSINMVKLNPFRRKPLPIFTDMITFSPTGDTIAVFDDHKGYIKDIKANKFIQPAIKLIDEAASTERKNFFFDASGTQVYFTTFNVKRQLYTLNKIGVKSGLITKVFDFTNLLFPYIHPDKSMLAAIEAGSPKVWNLATGKVIFAPKIAGGNAEFISLSNDKKRVLIVHDSATEIYDMATGSMLSRSEGYAPLTQFAIYACTPDLSMVFQCRADGQIDAINAQGKYAYSRHEHTSSVRRALFSPDSRIMYTISDDESIKVWQPQTGKLLGTLYLFNDGNDFVFIDPYGRFDGTEGGMKRMYYFRNRVKVSLDVVYERFYTPNLYQRLVNGEDFPPIDIIINPQPKVRISYAEVSRNLNVVEDKVQTYNNTTGVAEITVNASAENDKVDEIRLFHNGKIVNLATRGLFVTDNNTGTDTKKYTLNLLPGVNNIRAVALNSQRTESEPDEILVNYKVAGQPDAPVPVNNNKAIIAQVDKNATMHLVVIGINAYKNPKMSLNYALADATAFKDEAEKDAKTIISNLKTYFVTDDKADKNGIVAAFTEVQKNAKPQDVFVFYYAGHGVISEKNKEFYLVPNNVTDLKNVDEALAQNGIPSKMLQQYAIDIPAQKQVFILDACQSAGAFQQLLAADGDQQKNLAVVARSTGTHWIAASGSQQFAQEFAQLGHGAFTYVLLKAMQGEAASNKMITINGLKNFLQVQVPGLMKKYNGAPQYPATYGYGNDFPVEVMK